MRLLLTLFLLFAANLEIYSQQAFAVNGINVGMTIDDVRAKHPNSIIEKVANKYGNCADDNETGFEISKGSSLIALVILDSNQKIMTMIVTSPQFTANGISTKSRVSTVLKNYPNAKLELNSLDDREYVRIDNHITLGFETDDKNRIGIYNDETFVRLNRKNARADFIKIE